MNQFLNKITTAIQPQMPQDVAEENLQNENNGVSLNNMNNTPANNAIAPASNIAPVINSSLPPTPSQEAALNDLADIDAQTKANKEIIKSEIAKDNAIKAVSLEKAKSDSEDLQRIGAELEKENEELKNFSIEDIVKDQKTANKGLAALGIIIAGIGAGMTGSGRNLGLEAYNAALDREFDKQKLGLEQRLAKKQRIYDLLKLKVNTATQQTEDKLKQQQLALTNQRLQLEIDAINNQRIAEKQRLQYEDKARRGELDPNQEAAYISSLSPEDKKRYVPGFGLAKDPEQAKNAISQINVAEQAQAQVNNIRKLFKDYGTREVLDRGAVAEEQSARRNLQLQLKELFNLGVLNGPDLELLEEATGGNFFSVTTTDAAKNAKLNSIEGFIKQRVNSSLKNAGLNPAGESKRDLIIQKYKMEGLSDSQAAERYNKLVQSGLLKP